MCNKPKEHIRSIICAFEKCPVVLVEKPLAITEKEIFSINEFALKSNKQIIAANVFNFCNYFDQFADMLPDVRDVVYLKLWWADPEFETRYGASKTYDHTVSLYVDVLPHVVSILKKIFKLTPKFKKNPKISNGGAKIVLELLINQFVCEILIERKSATRRRQISVSSTKGNIT